MGFTQHRWPLGQELDLLLDLPIVLRRAVGRDVP
jgi:hypothetical protein